MIKKYFAMTIIAASVALVACGSDDDDDDVGTTTAGATDAGATDAGATDAGATDAGATDAGTTDGGTTDGGTTDGGTTDGGTTDGGGAAAVPATPGVGGTAFDSIVNNDDLQSLEDAIVGANLADTLDDPANTFTIFAPSNDALAQAMADLGDGFPADDALARLLQYHVIPGAQNSAALSTLVTDAGEAVNVETILTDLAGTADEVIQTVELAADGVDGSGLSVNGITISQVDIEAEADGGFVHIIDGVLVPPAAPEPTDPVDPPTGAASGLVDLLGDEFSVAIAALDSTYGEGTFESAQWTLFLPSNTTLGTITELSADQINGHLHTTPLNEADLAAEIGSTITSAGGTDGATVAQEIAITDSGSGEILVGGFAATFLGQVAEGALVYQLGGILPALETGEAPAQ